MTEHTDDIIDWGDIGGVDEEGQDEGDIDYDIIVSDDIDVSQIIIEGTGEIEPINEGVCLLYYVIACFSTIPMV